MAFVFPTRFPEKLFFPTVHIHDGEVHKTERFDHTLYCQIGHSGAFAMQHWEPTPGVAESFTKPEKSMGLLEPQWHVHRRSMRGMLKNEDMILETA